MLFLLLIFLIIILRWFSMGSNNSIRLRLIILGVAICRSITIGLLISSWYAIILALIYIGGVIIIFSYFVRFNSNSSIQLGKSLQFIILPIIIIKRLNLCILVPINIGGQIIKIYKSSNIIIILLIAIILLFVIIIIIKIVKINNRPLRGYKFY